MDEYSSDSDSDSCGELQIHIEEDEKLEIENDLASKKDNCTLDSTVHEKINNLEELTTQNKDNICKPVAINFTNDDSTKTTTTMVTRNRKTDKMPAKSRRNPKNQSQENIKEEVSDESDNSNLPEDCKILDKKLSLSAEKNQLTDANIKNIIKRVVSNEHVLAIVKLREEELLNEDDNPQPKLTRAKTKELLKTHPTVKPPWPLPITPVKIPDIVSPEVSSLILQDLPEEESDEEYKPGLDDHESDDDKDTITSMSDLESMPKTPYTPGELESPMKLTDDGIFKMPRDINEFRSPGKVVDDEATIALRTRSKLCLSDTPIENIENCFIPPDVPKDMLNMNKNEIDDVWIDFLTEFTRPLSQTHEDDDETDPEYNAAVEKENVDSEELRADPEVNIEMDEVNDLIYELIDCQNLWEIQESFLNVKKNENQEPSQNQGKKLSIEITDKHENCDVALNTPKDEDNTQITILQIDNNKNSTPQIKETVRIVNNDLPAPTLLLSSPSLNNSKRISPKNSHKQSSAPKKSTRINNKSFLKKIHEHQSKKLVKVKDGTIDFQPHQIQLLAQHVRQHIQLLTQGYLQLYGHSEWWHYANKPKDLLLDLKQKVDEKPNSVLNVENLEPAINVCSQWEDLFVKDADKANKIFKHNKESFERMREYRANGDSYVPKFSHDYFRFVGDISGVFLYSFLLPKMPYRPSKKVKKYIPSEERLIALGLEQFYFFIADNNLERKKICYTDSLKVSELISKYTMYAKSPVRLQRYIINQKIPSKNKNGINPIRYFFDNLEAPETHHVMYDYDLKTKVKEFPVAELPKCFQLSFGLVPHVRGKKRPDNYQKIEPIRVAPNRLVVAPKPNYQILPNTFLLPKTIDPKNIAESTQNVILDQSKPINESRYKVNVPCLKTYAKLVKKELAVENEKQSILDQERSEKTLRQLLKQNKKTRPQSKIAETAENCIENITPLKRNPKKKKVPKLITNEETSVKTRQQILQQYKNQQTTDIDNITSPIGVENITSQKGKTKAKAKGKIPKTTNKENSAISLQKNLDQFKNKPTDIVTETPNRFKKYIIPNKTKKLECVNIQPKPINTSSPLFAPILPNNKNQPTPVTQPVYFVQQPNNTVQPSIVQSNTIQQSNIVTPATFIPILPKGKTIAPDELVQIITSKQSLFYTNQNGQIVLNIIPQNNTVNSTSLIDTVPVLKNEDLNGDTNDEVYEEITIDETPIKIESVIEVTQLCEEQTDQQEEQPSLNSININQNNDPKSFKPKRELLHLINIIRKIKICNLDKVHNNFMMLPSMPNLCTPSKSVDIDVSYTPNLSNNTLDPSNYQINAIPSNEKPVLKEPVSLDSVSKTKLTLTNIQKSKTIPKAQRELEVNQAMFIGNDQISDDQKTFLYARAYFHKIRSRLLNQTTDVEGSKYEELKNIFNSYNLEIESPCNLYKKVEKALGDEYCDLIDDFLTFLTPGQAAEIGRFMDYFQMNNMTEFIEKLQVYFAKKPAQIKKIVETLQKLIDNADTNNEIVSSETIKLAILPYIKANQYLVDWFLRLFPEEKPPESFSKHGYEVLDVTKHSKEDEISVLDHEILNIPAEETGLNEECLCSCHNISDDKNKKKSRHCVSCGMKYLQGRVYVQNGKTLRPAHVTWEPGSADPSRLLSNEIPRLNRKRTNSFDTIPSAQNRGDSDDERLSPKRPMKQLRTPNTKQKLKINHNPKILSKADAKTTTDKSATVPDTTEADGDNRNVEACKSGHESQIVTSLGDDHITKSGAEDISWTREEDKSILLALQMENENESTLEKICRLLPHRKEEEVIVRLQYVMKILHKIINDK